MLQTTDIPYIEKWYEDSTGYFFTESEWPDSSGEPHERARVAYRLNLQHGKIAKIDLTPSKLAAANKVKDDFDPRQYEDCMSK